MAIITIETEIAVILFISTKFSFKLLKITTNPEIILNAAIIGSFINIKLNEKTPNK